MTKDEHEAVDRALMAGQAADIATARDAYGSTRLHAQTGW